MTLTPKIDELVDSFQLESEKLAETMEAFDRDFQSLLAQARCAVPACADRFYPGWYAYAYVSRGKL